MSSSWHLRYFAGLLLSVAIAPCLRADEDFTPEQKKFFDIPEATWKLQAGPMTPADLPQDLRPLALQAARRVKDQPPEESLKGAAIDLNGDGSKEYFIETVGGGSGGPMYSLFSRIDGAWKVIFTFQGSFQAIPGRDKWPEAASISRGGGGHYARCRAHLQNRKYEIYRIDRYHDGEITREEVKPSAGE